MAINPQVVISLLSIVFNPNNVKIEESQANEQEITLYHVIENIIKESVNTIYIQKKNILYFLRMTTVIHFHKILKKRMN